MTEKAPSFRSVMRGYDPAQVDSHLSELASALDAARREAADRSEQLSRTQSARVGLAAEVDDLRAHSRSLEEAQRTAEEPSYTGLGERIGTMLRLADEEATELRARARSEAEEHRSSSAAAVAAARAESDRHVEQARSRSEAEATTLLEDARHRAEELILDAEGAAQARREEGEALWAGQQARMTTAAADFEATLAERRDRAAAEFAAQLAQHDQQLVEAQARAELLAQESDAAHAQARSDAEVLLEQARAEASQVVRASHEQAERVRTASDRELAAATARRDSINSQLAHVRQVLSTLGGPALPQEPAPDTRTDGRDDGRDDGATIVLDVQDPSGEQTSANH